MSEEVSVSSYYYDIT